MALAQPQSQLPATQQRRRQVAEAKLAANAEADVAAAEATAQRAEAEAAAAATATAEATEVAEGTGDDGESITLTRGQLNTLQGASDRSARAERDAQLARMEAEEARAALTAMQQSRKDSNQAGEPLDLGFSEADTELLPEEEERFGESKEFVVKLVRAEFARLMKGYNASVSSRIDEVKGMASEASTRVTRSAQKSFVGRVRAESPDVDKLVAHPNFKDFLESVVPMTNLTYNTALNTAHADEDLKAATDIFEAFRKKYGVKKTTTAGYNGGAPNAAAGDLQPQKKNKHSMAERTKKSSDYRKGRISKSDFDEYKVSFDAALEAGQVDD